MTVVLLRPPAKKRENDKRIFSLGSIWHEAFFAFETWHTLVDSENRSPSFLFVARLRALPEYEHK